VLAACGVLGLRLPAPYNTWFTGQETWKAVVVPLLIAGASYAIGDLMEATFRWLWRPIDSWVFPPIADKLRKRYKDTIPQFETSLEMDAYRYDVWEWFSLKQSKEYPAAFSHAHRFQSEARMFFNSALPAGALVGYWAFEHWEQMYIAVLCGLAVAAFLFGLSLASERRRWVQVLDAARQFSFEWKHGGASSPNGGT
jgi:hypothetical protein